MPPRTGTTHIRMCVGVAMSASHTYCGVDLNAKGIRAAMSAAQSNCDACKAAKQAKVDGRKRG